MPGGGGVHLLVENLFSATPGVRFEVGGAWEEAISGIS
jgi:hypothetical protein